jgi:glycerate kinase
MSRDISALISMNAFKGTLSNVDACRIVAEALGKVGIESRQLPVGDGGAGTLSTVQASLGGVIETIEVSGPLAGKAYARVLCLPDMVYPTTLYIECAEACGFTLVKENERDAMRASSYGLGELILKCLETWRPSVRKIYVGLGDSLTSDAGMGMLYALGFKFFDDSGHTLWGNAAGLRTLRSWRAPSPEPFRGVKFTVLCDVLNPLCGPNGSARTFAMQKGATPQQVKWIEEGMENFAKLIELNMARNVRPEPMTGSAGGLAAAFKVFLKAELVHGARFLMDWIHYDTILDQHSFIVTGEGQIDSQTLAGKAPVECVDRAEKRGKKSVVFCGTLGPSHENFASRPGVVACVACGSAPTARDALYAKAVEVFSNADLVGSLS